MMRNPENSIRTGIILIIAGFFTIMAGMLLLSREHAGTGGFGGLIMIGPIPIAFGSSSEITSTMTALGLAILVIYYMMWRQRS